MSTVPEVIEEEENTQPFYTREQAEAWIAATRCFRDEVMIAIVARTGMRIGEDLGLAVEDIDWKRRQVTIVHQKHRVKLSCPNCGRSISKRFVVCPYCRSSVTEYVQKKTSHKRFRVIPIDKETLDLIREYVARGGPTAVQTEDGVRHQLFSIKRQRAWQIFTEAAMRAGLPKIKMAETGQIHLASPHRLRDAFATGWADKDSSDKSMRLLQEMLGHKDINTTQHYVKVLGSKLRDQYDKTQGESE